MASFDIAVSLTLAREYTPGHEYENDPTDRGGETKYGIDKRSHPDLDIKNLTLEHAKGIYRSQYWHTLYDSLSSQLIANKLFDTGVNIGPSRAVRIAQKACVSCGIQLVIDGRFGPGTLSAINAADPVKLLESMREQQASYYRAIVAKDPSQARFIKGWLRRAAS